MGDSIEPTPPAAPPFPAAAPPQRPSRCFITWLGLLVLLAAFVLFTVILVGQRISTGSFARGNGFVLGRFGHPMLLAFCCALLLLLVGSLVDSVRYGRWKKAAATGRS